MGFKTKDEASCASRRPRFTESFPTTLTHIVDDFIDLTCTIDGLPQPDIFWYYNHQPFNKNCTRIKILDGNQTLRIRRAKLDDAGIYSCIAKNELGQVEKSCTLIVERNPIIRKPEILQQPDDIICSKGDNIVISCISSFVAVAGAFFLWEKNGKTLRESDNVQYEREMISDDSMCMKLKISNVQCEDAGKYSLLSMNQFGNTSSKESIVVVSC